MEFSHLNLTKARAALEPLRQLNNKEYNRLRHKILTIEDNTQVLAERMGWYQNGKPLFLQKKELLLIEEINKVLARQKREAAKNNNKEAANVST
ncbi:hypothetical protein [Mycoplasmopsis columbinasalis]|uniref:Uncharacterized protein n=1 Tax=Mycoplasmopsis columbinasalis TaxID=114880 RepID=A0A449B9P4_9BACT|nr:hypothetical protein [Mycoplasmopsis columbinasalis]VEU77901.1 Uncharacterised protein [Mycoplasmopsis columbinasalis]